MNFPLKSGGGRRPLAFPPHYTSGNQSVIHDIVISIKLKIYFFAKLI